MAVRGNSSLRVIFMSCRLIEALRIFSLHFYSKFVVDQFMYFTSHSEIPGKNNNKTVRKASLIKNGMTPL